MQTVVWNMDLLPLHRDKIRADYPLKREAKITFTLSLCYHAIDIKLMEILTHLLTPVPAPVQQKITGGAVRA